MKDIAVWQAAASLVLVVLAVVLGLWFRLGLTRQILVASVRAAVQLLAVGLVFGALIRSPHSMVLTWVWVFVMAVIAGLVVRRRTPQLFRGGTIAFVVVVATVGLGLAVILGLGIVDYRPVNVLVVAGITIGNVLPAQVLVGDRVVKELSDGRPEVEAMLSLGMSVPQVVKLRGVEIVRLALIPQIERTNVVGLIALPGAMTGLLLAGADPVDAVLVQLVVMYLVLGAVTVAVILTTTVGLRALFTDDARLGPAP